MEHPIRGGNSDYRSQTANLTCHTLSFVMFISPKQATLSQHVEWRNCRPPDNHDTGKYDINKKYKACAAMFPISAVAGFLLRCNDSFRTCKLCLLVLASTECPGLHVKVIFVACSCASLFAQILAKWGDPAGALSSGLVLHMDLVYKSHKIESQVLDRMTAT